MSEQAPQSINDQNFQAVQREAGTLYLPNHVAKELAGQQQDLAPWEMSAGVQEMRAQTKAFGTDGLGSLRNESSTDVANEERQERMKEYESMTMGRLIKELAKAELNNEQDKFTDLDIVISKKVEDYADRQKDDKHPQGLNDDEREQLHAEVRARKEQVQEKLNKSFTTKDRKPISSDPESDVQPPKRASKSEVDSKRAAARWYTATRAHAEAPDEIDMDRGPVNDEVQRLQDKDHQVRLNAREGKDNPTEDDISYYRWLKNQSDSESVKPSHPSDTPEPIEPIDPSDIEPPMEPTEDELSPIPLPPEIDGKLTLARDAYVELMAKRRGVSTIGYKKKLEAAQKAYEEARNEAGVFIAEQLRVLGKSEEEINLFAHLGAILEVKDLTIALRDRQLEHSEGKHLRKFYDWWARQGGKFFSVGTVKKGAAMAAIGLVPGVALATAGAVVLGPAIGVAAGAAIARGVAKGLMSGKVNKEAGAKRIATEQASYRFENSINSVNGLAADGHELTTEVITGLFEQDTRKDVKRNRIRMAGSVAIAAGAGVAGAVVGSQIHDAISGGNKPTGGGKPEVGGAAKPPSTGGEVVPTPSGPSVPSDLVATDARFPWTVWTERMGTNGTPKIQELVEKARGLNIEFLGNGQGGGVGAITEVRLPSGQAYTDLGHINAYLDYVDSH